MYPIRYTDSEGKPLKGSKKYVIQFKSAPLAGRSAVPLRSNWPVPLAFQMAASLVVKI